jgi:hypothetical protein
VLKDTDGHGGMGYRELVLPMKTSSLILTLAFVPFGCGPAGQSPPTANDAAAQVPATAAAESRPASNPSAPAPAATREATPKPRPRLVVPAGTLLPIEMQSTISSDSSQEGDSVLAVLTEDVPLDGFTLDKGAEVRGRIFTSVPAKRVQGRARLVFGFEAVMENGEKIAFESDAIDTTGESTGSKDKKIIGGGALGGLIVGAIKDGKKGAAIGTVIGAAAGTGAVLIMKGHEVEIPRGARLTIAVSR